MRTLTAREKLPSGLVYAVMRQESAFDPGALSPAKAVGLLQLMPDTARRVASETGAAFDPKDLTTPNVNMDIGARYLAKMVATFGGSVPLAVAAYNAGPVSVDRWVKRADGVPLDVWAALIPYEETRTYVVRVLTNFARYAYLEGGAEAVPAFEMALPKNMEIASDAY